MAKIRHGKFYRSSPSQIETECKWCNRKMYLFANYNRPVRYGNFCGRICLGAFRSSELVSEKAANYKTGSRKSRCYIEVEAHWHPNKNKRGYVYLHRILAEAKHDRFLSKDEVVHHLDHNPRNNHWSNLEILSQGEHTKRHLKRDLKTGKIIGVKNAKHLQNAGRD